MQSQLAVLHDNHIYTNEGSRMTLQGKALGVSH